MTPFDSDSKSRQRECKALLDACTPMVYRRSAFRISGLPVDASMRDIKRRFDNLKHAEELGDAAGEYGHAFALDPPPGLDCIREAVQRLQDPERRIIEELFWFWPSEWGTGKTDPALTALATGDKDAAFKMWSEAISEDHSAVSIVAKHNLAIMYQVVALDSEYIAFQTDMSAEQRAAIAAHWRTCFTWWEDLTDDDAFWSLVADRIRMLDDPRLTTGLARRIRGSFPDALHTINAMLAVQFAESGKFDIAAEHVNYLKESLRGLGNELKTLLRVTEPLRTRIRAAVEMAGLVVVDAPATADKAAVDLLQMSRGPLRVIEVVLPADDHERIDICDAVASVCLDCAKRYGQATDGWGVSLSIIEMAEAVARSDSIKAAVSKAKHEAADKKEFSHPKVKELLEIIRRIEMLDYVEKIKEIYRRAPDLLSAIETACGRSSRAYELCADAVARTLRNIAVDLYNSVDESIQTSDRNKLLVLSLEIHDRGASLACSRELTDRFREDDSALSACRASFSGPGLRWTIRSALVREGLLPLWGDQDSPPQVQERYRKENVGGMPARKAEGQKPPPVPSEFRRERVGTHFTDGWVNDKQDKPKKMEASTAGFLLLALVCGGWYLLYSVLNGGLGSSQPSRPSTVSSPSRQPAVTYPQQTTYDTRSASRSALSQEIDAGKSRAKLMETQIGEMDARLEEYSRKMSALRSSGMIDEYNNLVPTYNALVNQRKQVYESYSRVIEDVNAKVNRYNAGY